MQAAAARLPPKPAAAATVSAAMSTLTFEGLLKSYYRSATATELEAMLAIAEPQHAKDERRRWIADAKAQHAERIRMAFLMGDANGDGVLSMAEFAEAVALHRGQRGAAAAAAGEEEGDESSSGAISQEELAAVFEEADKDHNGVLDLDEFMALIASHPKLMNNFEDLIEAGVQRRLREEERRLNQLFKAPVSPQSRSVLASPSGRRRRPSLADLRAVEDVRMPTDQSGRLIRRTDQLTAEASSAAPEA